MLFGLGVIGGLHGPDLGVNAPHINGPHIDGGGIDINGPDAAVIEGGEYEFGGAKYSSSSVTVDTKVINKTKDAATPTDEGKEEESNPNTGFQLPPTNVKPTVVEPTVKPTVV